MNDINYSIRFGIEKDWENIKNFINQNWKKAQTINNKVLFDYYFRNTNGILNFVLAEKFDGQLVGVLGFIPCNENCEGEVWGSCWRVLKTDDPMLAVRMVFFLQQERNVEVSGVNNDSSTRQLWGLLGQVEEMSHYYRLADLEEYKIARIARKEILNVEKTEYKLVKIHSMEQLRNCFCIPANRRPYKDFWYIQKRYFECPFFQYNVYAIEKKNQPVSSILITRDVILNDTGVLRIVDFIGKDLEFGEIGWELQRLLEEGDYEFLDMWCWGLEESMIQNAGLSKVNQDSPNIIPDKYEPLIQMNETILCSSTKEIQNFYAFRADDDGDRPNLINVDGEEK